MNFKECTLNLKELFENIKDTKYFVTKINTPFFKLEKKFPELYPVGRDVDLLTHPCDFENICSVVHKFCEKQDMVFRIIHDSPTHRRYRLESPDYFLLPNAVPGDKLRNGLPLTKLHFQIDVSSIEENEYSGVDTKAFEADMNNPTFENGVKILDNKNEVLLRCVFYAKSKSRHHRDFIYQNRDLLNTGQILDREIWSAINPVVS